MKRLALFLLGTSICCACETAETSADDSIEGIYVREYSREILNQLSGNKVGVRTVRDTLYISPSGNGYRIANARWRMNDYDNDGWQNMEHAEGGPWPSFDATYDSNSKSLNPETTGGAPSLVVDDRMISVGGKSDIVYNKVE
jgi:hypothetical protein